MTVAPTAPFRILVIDDVAPMRRMMSRTLGDSNHLVSTADSGAAGLDLLRRRPFDLVITDIRFDEGPSGVEVLRTIKASPETRDTPVVVISGSVGADELGRCLDLGAADCFEKPLNMVLFKRKIDALMSRRPRLSPGSGKHILYVDDEDYWFDLVKTWLSGDGFRLSHARCRRDLKGLVDVEPLPDCILLDADLGIEDGISLCDELKRAPATQRVPIVMLTGHPEKRLPALQHEAVYCVEKSSKAGDELRGVLVSILAQQARTLGLIDLGDLRLDGRDLTVRHRGRLVATLDHGPFTILRRLVEASPEPVPDDELRRCAAVRSPYRRDCDALPPRTLENHLYNLRSQLGTELGGRIRRVSKLGYSYVP